jgi:hypothetical protein
MAKNVEGVYWETDQNEYNVQIHHKYDETATISRIFHDWELTATGAYTKEDQKISIFRKKFTHRMELKIAVRDIKYKNNITLKEIK